MQRGTIEERNMPDYIADGIHYHGILTVIAQNVPYMQYQLHSRARELLVLQSASLMTEPGCRHAKAVRYHSGSETKWIRMCVCALVIQTHIQNADRAVLQTGDKPWL